MCAKSWPVHLVCFARTEKEVDEALALREICASVYVERLRKPLALSRAALRFGTGSSLTLSFYLSNLMKNHVRSVTEQVPLFAALAYSSAMAQYAPKQIPLVLDMVDVDSEKWLQFSATRHPAYFFRTEGRRLRCEETRQVQGALRTFVTTARESQVLARFAPQTQTECMGNGVDSHFFDPQSVTPIPAAKRPVVFVGAMDYYPNADAVCWFADKVFPEWRRRQPGASFWIVGRNPTARVKELARTAGIRVTGEVDDVRPYLAAAEAVVAPLQIARGIQNKVLEALAMGKRVFASPDVAACFDGVLPQGVSVCETPEDYLTAFAAFESGELCNEAWNAGIRAAAARDFSWEANLRRLQNVLEPLARASRGVAVTS